MTNSPLQPLDPGAAAVGPATVRSKSAEPVAGFATLVSATEVAAPVAGVAAEPTFSAVTVPPPAVGPVCSLAPAPPPVAENALPEAATTPEADVAEAKAGVLPAELPQVAPGKPPVTKDRPVPSVDEPTTIALVAAESVPAVPLASVDRKSTAMPAVARKPAGRAIEAEQAVDDTAVPTETPGTASTPLVPPAVTTSPPPVPRRVSADEGSKRSPPLITGPAASPAPREATSASPGGDARSPQPSVAAPEAGPATAPVAAPRAVEKAPVAEAAPAVPSAAPTPVAASRAAEVAEPRAAEHRLALGHDFADQLGLVIARHAKASGNELTVHMQPAELGRIAVKLGFDDGGSLRAVVSSDNAQLLDQVRRDLPDLTRALGDAGVRADAGSFRFERGASDFASTGNDPPSGDRSSGGDARNSGDRRQPARDQAPRWQRPARRSGRLDLMA